MGNNKNFEKISEWRQFSELTAIDKDISGLGYKREYIEEHQLKEAKTLLGSGTVSGVINFDEPLEVKAEGDEIVWRQIEKRVYWDAPETFNTQFGLFINHNNGEFASWLEKANDETTSLKEGEEYGIFDEDDFFVPGNYCDMFDFGDYTYAVSNLMHLSIGNFKIIKIDGSITAETLYENISERTIEPLEYLGRFKKGDAWYIIASGFVMVEHDDKDRNYKKRTLLLRIDKDGNFSISKEWEIEISRINSMAVNGDYVYFGQNKMVSRLNISSGEISYYTNKSNEEIAALTTMW